MLSTSCLTPFFSSRVLWRLRAIAQEEGPRDLDADPSFLGAVAGFSVDRLNAATGRRTGSEGVADKEAGVAQARGEGAVKIKYNTPRRLMTDALERPHACPKCQKAFARKDGVQRHLANVHPEPQPAAVPAYQTATPELLPRCRVELHRLVNPDGLTTFKVYFARSA